MKMYERVLARIRSSILSGDYFLTFHAEEEMGKDRLTVYDVEAVALSGRIVSRQRDKTGYKYVLIGQTTALEPATIVAKLVGPVVIITVFLGTP